ncbi:MAG: initiation control protein YabA [Thermanaeromonas sp.]|uniref:initiation control protein YabA n=1 Tax=Thermanaeromonas sp. TaxID=2003697 RepID=UPI00243B2E12|nr:initiation control protein YabA [Thermanaeromonas sp.]MCG0277353.1 initiation control protein YabA [Thermanaeromonas sp.]
MSEFNPEDTLIAVLAGLEVKVAEIQRELRRLKALARNLEEENTRLRAWLTEAASEIKGEDKLRLLYEQGYHICPAQFGRVRSTEGCLFCHSFLEKRG